MTDPLLEAAARDVISQILLLAQPLLRSLAEATHDATRLKLEQLKLLSQVNEALVEMDSFEKVAPAHLFSAEWREVHRRFREARKQLEDTIGQSND